MAASAEELLEALMEFIIQGRTGMPPHPNDPKFGIGGSNLTRKTSRGGRKSSSAAATFRMPTVKKTRKVSRYQKVFGKHLKALKRKHPRTSTSILMKKAHRLTKREIK